jgi:hypothetical protein
MFKLTIAVGFRIARWTEALLLVDEGKASQRWGEFISCGGSQQDSISTRRDIERDGALACNTLRVPWPLDEVTGAFSVTRVEIDVLTSPRLMVQGALQCWILLLCMGFFVLALTVSVLEKNMRR